MLLYLIDIFIIVSANLKLSFFAPLKVWNFVMFVLFKNFCYSYLKWEFFSQTAPFSTYKKQRIYFKLISFLYLGTVF